MRPRLDHLLARAPIHRAPQRLQVGLLRTPLGEVGQPPLGEAVRGVDHGPVAVAAGASLAHHARPVLGIDAAIAAHADLGEPDPADRARLAVAQLDGHADAAHVPVAVVRERALAGEEALAVLGPGQRRPASLAVEGGEELWGGAQLLAPLVPRFLSFRQPSGTVPGDEEAKPVAGLLRVVPSARAQRHVWADLRVEPFFCSRRAVE